MPAKNKTARRADDEEDKKVLSESKQESKKVRASSKTQKESGKTIVETKVTVKTTTRSRNTSKEAPKDEKKKQDPKKKGAQKISKIDIEKDSSADEEEEEEEETTKKSKPSGKNAAKETKKPAQEKPATKNDKKGKSDGKSKKDIVDEVDEKPRKEEKKNDKKPKGKIGAKAEKGEEEDEDEDKEVKKDTGKGGKKKAEKKKGETDEKEEKDEDAEENADTKKGKEKKKRGKSAPKADEGEKKAEEGEENKTGTTVAELKRQMTGSFDTGDGNIPSNKIKISSWNVNGLRAALSKGNLQNYLKSHNLDIICFNETKIDEDKLNDPVLTKNFPPEYFLYFNCCKSTKGYSGTGIASKYKPLAVYLDLGVPKHDQEGRTITLEFEHFFLISCYVPNAGQGLNRLDYRTKEWDADFRKFIVGLKQKKHVIWCGDLNVAHQEIDIYDPKGNRNKTAGFTDREREEFSNLLKEGFVDSFRELHPNEVKYSWWSMRTGARKVNKGWRLDYFVIDKEGIKSVVDSTINNDIEGSDHCPIELVFNPNFA